MHPLLNGSDVCRCRGQTCVEWLIAAFTIFAGLSLVLEASHWYVNKQLLVLHAQRAVEYGAMRGGQTQSIYQHLNQHLSGRTLRLGAICVQDDVPALMSDFIDVTLSREHRRPLIRYNHIAAQHHHHVNHTSSAHGKGPQSGLTIAQANVLHIRVTAYLPVELLWMRALIGPDLKLVVQSRAVMQSHREKLTQKCMGKHLTTRSQAL